MSSPLHYLSEKLRRGPFVIGQVSVSPDFTLCHRDDAGRNDLEVFANPHDAIQLARYDDTGKYRPLKSAANLRHGWKLAMKNERETLLALDFLYPAAIGTAAAREMGRLSATALRTTLGRQSGMYAVTGKITTEEATRIIAQVCTRDCLRKILWSIEEGRGHVAEATGSDVPIWCAEACNLLVAAARKAVKERPAETS